MVVSVELPDSLAAKIDAEVRSVEKPRWPFLTREVSIDRMSKSDRKKYEAYDEQYRLWFQSRTDPEFPRNRSSVLRNLIKRHYEGVPPVVTSRRSSRERRAATSKRRVSEQRVSERRATLHTSPPRTSRKPTQSAVPVTTDTDVATA